MMFVIYGKLKVLFQGSFMLLCLKEIDLPTCPCLPQWPELEEEALVSPVEPFYILLPSQKGGVAGEGALIGA